MRSHYLCADKLVKILQGFEKHTALWFYYVKPQAYAFQIFDLLRFACPMRSQGAHTASAAFSAP